MKIYFSFYLLRCKKRLTDFFPKRNLYCLFDNSDGRNTDHGPVCGNQEASKYIRVRKYLQEVTRTQGANGIPAGGKRIKYKHTKNIIRIRLRVHINPYLCLQMFVAWVMEFC